MEISVTIEGQESVRKGFKKLRISEDEFANILRRACVIVENKAKQILLENGHYITGSLMRSIRTIVGEMAWDTINAKVGSHLHYAFYVEVLPDGGYLFRAIVETGQQVIEYIIKELNAKGIK